MATAVVGLLNRGNQQRVRHDVLELACKLRRLRLLVGEVSLDLMKERVLRAMVDRGTLRWTHMELLMKNGFPERVGGGSLEGAAGREVAAVFGGREMGARDAIGAVGCALDGERGGGARRRRGRQDEVVLVLELRAI